tara:strand:+ start:5804 stop:7423 length:1620 start_codon:yes stop_codon:yes gene_type:complete
VPSNNERSILIIAPSLIAESLSLKLTSLDNNLNVYLNTKDINLHPDIIIWNILNYQSEDLIRLELLRLKERWQESQILVIFSGDFIKDNIDLPNLTSEGLLLNPTATKVLSAINTIIEGGRVFDIDKKKKRNIKKTKVLSFNQRILTSGLKQIDNEINKIFYYLNKDSTPELYKFILRGRLRELVTAKSLLIFLWGNSLEIYTEQTFSEEKDDNLSNEETIFINKKDSIEIWNLIYNRLTKRYAAYNLDFELLDSTIILSGLKKEYISRLICNILSEIDNLIKNLKENYHDKSYEDDFISLINQLKKNTISNITDSYLRIKRNSKSIDLSEYIFNSFNSLESDTESHNSMVFINPIVKNIPLDLDGKLLPLYETESFKLIESIISNWVIRTSNILASEIFNYCSSWPELRNLLINPKLQSTRSFERFRNNINNYNRWHNNIYMPIYLYESKREYIDIVDNKLIRYFKNENREKDLENLEWFQKQVTLLVEIRDALAPQIEIAVKYIGDIFVTFLTKVLGKAIGLIGRGIIQGLGKSTQK